jgi:hypothetical protein
MDGSASSSPNGASGETPEEIEKRKTTREIEKLDLEIEKLRGDIAESNRSYLNRNPQVIPTAIAALGAIIGLGVGLYSNYFTTIHEKADLEQKLATKEKQDADADRLIAKQDKTSADAERSAAMLVRGEAENLRNLAVKANDSATQAAEKAHQTQIKADEILRNEGAKIAQANQRIQAANQQAQAAEQKNAAYKTYIHDANRDRFDSKSMPAFLYEQQDQLVDLGGISSVNFGWITDPNLRSLSFTATRQENGTVSFSALRTINPSIRRLSVSAYQASAIDLQSLAGIGHLEKLRIYIGSSGPDNVASVRSLKLAKNLESLDVEVSGARLDGIEDSIALPKMKNLRLSYDRPSSIPASVLGRVTGLYLSAARPIDPAPVSQKELEEIAANTRLVALSLPGLLDANQWKVLSGSRSIRELSVLNTKLPTAPGVTFENVTALLVPVVNMSDLNDVIRVFPRLKDFAISLGGPLNQWKDPNPLLQAIAAAYPRLHSLTIISDSTYGVEVVYSFPKFAALETLRLQLYPGIDGHKVIANLKPENLPSLKKIVINCTALQTEQLLRLPKLRDLVLNDVNLESLDTVSKLNALESLSLSPFSTTQRPYESKVAGPAVQKAIEHSHLRSLDLYWAFMSGVQGIPSSVQSLSFGDNAQTPREVNWFSPDFFAETY